VLPLPSRAWYFINLWFLYKDVLLLDISVSIFFLLHSGIVGLWDKIIRFLDDGCGMRRVQLREKEGQLCESKCLGHFNPAASYQDIFFWRDLLNLQTI